MLEQYTCIPLTYIYTVYFILTLTLFIFIPLSTLLETCCQSLFLLPPGGDKKKQQKNKTKKRQNKTKQTNKQTKKLYDFRFC